MSTPPDAAPPPTTTSRRRRPVVAGLGAAIVAIVVAGAISAAVVHGGGSTPTTPAAVTDAYYAALRNNDPGKAYGYLCSQQRMGESTFAGEVQDNRRTGTGIRAWTRSGDTQQRGDESLVPGTVTTDDGTATPIQVLLVRQDGAWKVCTSNLGGILPSTGTGGSGGSPA